MSTTMVILHAAATVMITTRQFAPMQRSHVTLLTMTVMVRWMKALMRMVTDLLLAKAIVMIITSTSTRRLQRFVQTSPTTIVLAW